MITPELFTVHNEGVEEVKEIAELLPAVLLIVAADVVLGLTIVLSTLKAKEGLTVIEVVAD